ncbi:hypothetical protein [Nocardia callitridis]|uniref:MiAMP1 protein n=1 Tax=Nocardia callitridis TaxID=648753 RepID=A0ABP9K6M2_9NOCA
MNLTRILPVIFTAGAITAATVASAGAEAAAPSSSLYEGQQVVGTNVLAGTYYTAGPTEDDYGSCSITWLPYKGAKSSEATASDFYSGPSYVRLSAGDVITVRGCDWTLE